MRKKEPPRPARDSHLGDFTDYQIAELEEDIQRADEIIEKTKDAVARAKTILKFKQRERLRH